MTSTILTKAYTLGVNPPLLLVHITIDCDACGEYSIVLLGHHVKSLIQALQEVTEHAPDLTDGGDIEVLYRQQEHHTPGLN
jgi:hypothetical protein